MTALGLIYDVASSRLRELPMPHVPKPPLFDGKVSRGNKGFTWMSEMTLRDLEWWLTAKQKNADEGGQYAEQNRKAAATLGKWIEWRRLFPSEIWSGKRGEDRVTAAPPSRDAALNDWGPRTQKSEQKSNNSGPPQEDGEPEQEYSF